MASLRRLRTRVASIRSIQRVTSALQMVAAAKMRRAQLALTASRPYALELERLVRRLAPGAVAAGHPLFAVPAGTERALVVVVTSDRGLCGGLNAAICRRALALLREHEGRGVELVALGAKGAGFLRARGYQLGAVHAGIYHDLEYSVPERLAGELVARYRAGEMDRVELVFSEYRSAGQQVAAVVQLLPVVVDTSLPAGGVPAAPDYIAEPGLPQVVDALMPRYVGAALWRALLEVRAGEHAARMLAMDSASKNAASLLEDLGRQINKERQTAVTLELMDIVGGANAVRS